MIPHFQAKLQYHQCIRGKADCYERLAKKTSTSEDCESPARFQKLVKAAVLQAKSQYTPMEEGQKVSASNS